MEMILKQLREELVENSHETTKASYQRFFKEKVKYYGVSSLAVSKIAKIYWKKIKNFSKPDIYSLCEDLLSSDFSEEAFVVSSWGEKFGSLVSEEDITIFEGWIYRYLNNWAKCDSFCNHTCGNYFMKYPRQIPILSRWASSSNLWMRRASAVSLILPARKGFFLPEIFSISDQLLLDLEDLVRKGYGWLLKEASRKHQQEVLDFVISRKKNMPRIALRYAIELMPHDLKALAMQK